MRPNAFRNICTRLPRASSSTPPPPRPPVFRQLHTTRPRFAKYERFNTGHSGPTGPSGRPDIWSFIRRRVGSDRAVWLYGIGIGGGGIYYVAHLERVPETGRLRFIDVSEASERELGSQTQLQTLNEYGTRLLPPNHPTTRRVHKIATRIIEASGLGRVKSSGEMGAIEGKVPKWGGGGNEVDVGEALFGVDKVDASKETEWEVYVIDDPKTKNAFVLPGGAIFVFSGILPVSANDDGLATVMGHEIAHQVARHSAERMSYMKVLFGLGFLLESLGLDVGITRLVLTFMLQLPNSRKSESEADYIGLQLMSRACYNPAESAKMWERMSESEGGRGLPVDFLSTHPANAKRIKQLEAWLPEAQQIRAASPCGATETHFGGFLDSLGSSSGQGMGQTFWG